MFITKFILKAVFFIGAAFVLFSCEIKSPEVKGELNKNFSDRTIFNANVSYKDSGIIRMKLKAPLIESFTLIDSTYTLMRKGVDIQFWNQNEDKPNFLRADWAKIHDKKKVYEGRGNVVMINNDGDTLQTEQIFWDNKNRRIFTNKSVLIKRLDGSTNTSKNGIEASEDFKEFTLKNNSGIIIFEGDNLSNPPKIEKERKPEQDSVPLIEIHPSLLN